MKLRYLSLGAVAFGFIIAGSAPSANADIPGGSGCSGSGRWEESGLVVPAATKGGTYTIPYSDTVSWEGSVAGPPGAYSGSVTVDLPPGFPTITIDKWGGDSENTSNSGAHEYELPSLVPAGVEFKVTGQHEDKNGGCSGTITFKVEGGAFDSPVTLISLGATVIMFIGTGAALRPAFRKVI